MTKLKKQLIGLKIYRFFQANDLVLFFHYNSNTNRNWYAINSKFSSLNCAPQNTKQTKIKKQKPQEEPIAQMSSLLLKNKVAQKVFAAYAFKNSSSQAVRILEDSKEISYKIFANQIHNKDLQPPYFCVKEHKNILKKNSIELHFDAKKLQSNKNYKFKQLFALFQGPTFLLAFKNVLLLENFLNICKQENSLVLLGGFYNNNALLNEKDIYKLAKLSKSNWNTSSFVKELKKSTQPSLLLFKKALDFSILNEPQHQFLRILHYRIQQLTLL